MKRIAFHIGASCAIALLFANLLGASAALYISIAAGVLFAVSLLVKDLRQELVVPVITGTVMFSCLIFAFVWNNTVTPVQSLDNQRRYCTFQIIDIPQGSGSGNLYTVKIKSVKGDNSIQDFKARLYSSFYIDADYYDNVSAYLTFEKTAENGFDSYGDFGENVFIHAYTDYAEDSYKVEKTSVKPLNYSFIKLREIIKLHTAYITDGDEGALALAFFIGDKSRLSDETISNFKICGVYHVMAVSGLHASVICLGFYYILKRIGAPRLFTALSSFVLLLSYLAVADFSKSVTRSVIMVSVFIFAGLLKRKADLINSLGIAMILMCLNPFTVTDPSAVLTVCAVLGLGFVRPELSKLYQPKSSMGDYICDGLAVTASVMLTTLPAVMIFFNRVSLLGFLVNFLIIALAELTLLSVLFFNLLYFSAAASFLPKQLMIISSRAILQVVSFFADKLGRLYVDLSDTAFYIAVALCLAFCAVSIFAFRNIDIKAFCLFMAAVFVISGATVSYDNRNRVVMVVSDSSAVAVYNSECLLVIDADDTDSYYDVRDIALVRKFKKTVYVNCDFDNMRLSKLTDGDTEFYYDKKADIDLCDCIGIKCYKDRIDIEIYGRFVSVCDDCVVTDGYKAFRNVSDKFSDDGKYVFTFRDKSDTLVRREADG